MKNWQTYISVAALVAYLIKALVIPHAHFADALIILSLVSLVTLDQLRLKDKKIEAYDQKLSDLSGKFEKFEQDLRIIQHSNASIKTAIGMKPILNTKI